MYSYRRILRASRSPSRRCEAASGRPNQVRTPSSMRFTYAVRSSPFAAASFFRNAMSSRVMRNVCMTFSVPVVRAFARGELRGRRRRRSRRSA